jgi:hypothetical protein
MVFAANFPGGNVGGVLLRQPSVFVEQVFVPKLNFKVSIRKLATKEWLPFHHNWH